MSLYMYQASVPVFVKALNSMRGVLVKADAQLKARNVADATIVGTRLIMDMLPLSKQVQIACDMGCRASARLAGVEPQSFADTETTVAELCARIDTALAYINSFKPEQFDGAATRSITIKTGGEDRSFTGQSYLQDYVLPNLFFHTTMTYALLRQAGVPLGKKDFLGAA